MRHISSQRLNKTDFNYSAEFFEHVAILWADADVKLCFEGSKQYEFIILLNSMFFFQILCYSQYFLFSFFNRVNQIKEADYIPTDQVNQII